MASARNVMTSAFPLEDKVALSDVVRCGWHAHFALLNERTKATDIVRCLLSNMGCPGFLVTKRRCALLALDRYLVSRPIHDLLL